ncbi:MAG: type II secretion system protein [Gemmatimonadaceae bacterium]|nr:type II secretion system protein [Gemmatimonadaceae bacterium]
MTLLESLVALVILGLAAIGFLELFQRATVATRDTASWSQAVAIAELTMERAVLSPVASVDSTGGVRRRVELSPWARGLQEITVTVDVPPPAGARVVLHRLVVAR